MSANTSLDGISPVTANGAHWWDDGDAEPRIRFVHLTPAMAAELLAVNHTNRSLTETHRDALAGAIERGEWDMTASATMSITRDGQLADGQHRCSAVVKANRPIDVAIIFNASPGAQALTDQGRKRSFGDVLHIRGERDAKGLAAATRNIYWWERDGVPVAQNRPIAPTIPQLLEVLGRHGGLRDSMGRLGWSSPIATRSFAATHHYVFSMIDPEDADEFFRLLRTGDGLASGNPIHTLRERMIRAGGDEGSISLTKRSAFFHRAWHAWREGQSLMKLQFRIGGKRPDAFPVIRADDLGD